MSASLTDIEVFAGNGSDVSVHWRREGQPFRYHVWLHRDLTRVRLRDGWIYKNPAVGFRDAGYFHTRHLDASAKANAAMVAAALAHVREHKLIEAALAACEAEREAGRAEQERAAALHRTKEAGPALLAALKGLLEWGREHTSPRDPNSPHELLVAADAAVKLAEGGAA